MNLFGTVLSRNSKDKVTTGTRSLLKKKANIMLLVLFIMFVSSLLGLLVSQYVRNLIRVSSLFQEYYKSYYYAYGGLELGLAQVKHHGYGFEDDFVYSEFDACAARGTGCTTDLTITSRWNVVADTYSTAWTGCSALYDNATSTHKYYEVASGNAVIIPLFRDNTTGFATIDDNAYTNVSSTGLSDMTPVLYGEDSSSSETYLIKVVDEELENYDITLEPALTASPYSFAGDLGSFDSSAGNKNYLIIANATGSTKEFCLQLDGLSSPELVSKYVVIDSIGNFGRTNASLSAIKVEQLPSFLGYGTINSWE